MTCMSHSGERWTRGKINHRQLGFCALLVDEPVRTDPLAYNRLFRADRVNPSNRIKHHLHQLYPATVRAEESLRSITAEIPARYSNW